MMYAFQILAYLATHRDEIKEMILNIQKLFPEPGQGDTKAAAVRGFIAKSLNIEAQIEEAWPLVSGIFNLFVAKTKTEPTKV